MPNLANSQRTLYRATYVPTKLPAPAKSPDQATETTRVMAKVAYLRNLNIRPAEFAALQSQADQPARRATSKSPRRQGGQQATAPLLDVVRAVTTDLSPEVMRVHSPSLQAVSSGDLEALGRDLQDLRAQSVSDVDTALHQIRVDYANSLGTSPDLVALTDALRWAYTSGDANLQRLLDLIKQKRPEPEGPLLQDPNLLVERLTELLQEATSTKTMVDDFLTSFEFEPVGKIHLERIEMTPVGIQHGELVYSVPLTPKETVNITHREWSETSSTFENLVQESLEGFSEKGVTEKTDIATATSTETKHSNSFDANASVNFSYNGNPYSLTTSAAVNYGTKNDDSASIKDSRAHSMAITRTASSRSRKEHKQSFRVASVAGAEDLAVRVLTNPSDTNAIRVDYFRLMRKWQVDLIRYGLRMTYDLVVPNPGNALATKVREVGYIDQLLNQDFQFDVTLADVTPDTYRDYAAAYGTEITAPLERTSTTVTSPLQKSDGLMNAVLDVEVPEGYEIVGGELVVEFYGGSSNEPGVNVHDLPDPKAVLTSPPGSNPLVYGTNPQETLFNDAAGHWEGTLMSDLGDPNLHFPWLGRNAKQALLYSYYNVNNGALRLRIDLAPTQASIDAWQLTAWTALREAAQATWSEGLQRLRDHKTQLEQEINDYDSLTLRRMEREEIMRLVLVWLFGPSFQLVPTMFELLGLTESLVPTPDPLPEAGLDPGKMSVTEWATVRKYGEFIKYIQNAIEWENVLFFSYPYFWDLVENWPFKRFLVHPDFDHRTFLRAGCARVVLTIRPGFECSFAQLVEHFTLQTDSAKSEDCKGILGDQHPYVTIADEMQNFAMTNYAHLPPANPDHNVRPLLYPLQIRAWSEMQIIMQALDQYDRKAHSPANPPIDPDVHVYPAKLSDLPGADKLIPNNPSLNDPWGRPYVYKSPGDNGDYDLVSYGESGDPSKGDPATDDNPVNAHITSWAEGNVVGRWNEYTPTSALDVSINTVLPTTPQSA